MISKRMSIITSIVLAVIMLAVMVPFTVSNAATVTIFASGSTTLRPFVAAGESALEADFPSIDLTLDPAPGIGSTGGWNSLLADTCDVALCSSKKTSSRVDEWVVGKDGLCFVVKDSANMAWLTDITPAQLVWIYERGAAITTSHWDEVVPAITGAPHQLIVPRSRITDSGTRASVLDFLKTPGLTEAEEIATQTGLEPTYIRLQGNPDVCEAIEGQDYAIGYIGYGFTDDGYGIRALTINGIAASQSTIDSFTYPFSRLLYMYTLKPSEDPTYKLAARDFISWMQSDEGQGFVESEGFIRIAAQAPYWDTNNDHVCNLYDAILLGNKWMQTGAPGWTKEDMNGDGVVNLYDAIVLGNHWMYTW